MENKLVFDTKLDDKSFLIASSTVATSILVDSKDHEAVHIAAQTFAEDVERVTGSKPKVYFDTLPKDVDSAIIACTVESSLAQEMALRGQWEAFDIRMGKDTVAKECLFVTGSDKRGVIFGLYTLSEHMGVSPWYWWADVPVTRRSSVSIPHSATYSHGSPIVKYRGFFLNDEQPVLWNWAKEHFKMGNKPPFQVGMYEKSFELLLRLKGNYAWPAMWDAMFAVDGMDLPDGKLPSDPTPGPNQVLAGRMGIVMGTSHHEPMGRNQKEYTTWGTGPWNYEENEEFLVNFWKYGAERAKGMDTLFTVGMRGDGDLPLDGANVELLERITAKQQELLKGAYGDISKVPQMWAIYKEVMGYYANGLSVPEGVTAMLADDNWGNLMAVLPDDRRKPGAGGIYYHADYVGDPRDYKWINTVNLAKMWEQTNIARVFGMTEIWILNVGDLKFLESPLEYFMQLAYDSDQWPMGTTIDFLRYTAERDFGKEHAAEIADIWGLYSIYASRRKAELVDSDTYSLVHFNEADRILADWKALEQRAGKVYDQLGERKLAFYEMIYVQILLQTNLHELYNAAAKSNLYATQGRTAANVMAQAARDAFERDYDLTEEFNEKENGKWRHMLCQTHIGYQYWQMPVRNSLPPVSYISHRNGTFAKGSTINTRYTVENSEGAWPGDNRHNCPAGYDAPDPTLLPMDRYGQPRWVDVSSGGPGDEEFSVKTEHDWVKVEPQSGKITGDGKNDARVWISIDWDRAQGDVTHLDFDSTDGAHIKVTIPLRYPNPPADFHGAVEGDGYVAFEAAHCKTAVQKVAQTEHTWKEIPYYGRTHSGMALYPIEHYRLPLGKGPAMEYDFWSFAKEEVEVTLHLGPSNNWVIGERHSFGIQMDEGDIQEISPIPESKPGNLSDDWETIVANEIREVKVRLPLGKEGKHCLKVYGVTPGLVFERVLIDCGGIAARGYSYLGPPESVIL